MRLRLGSPESQGSACGLLTQKVFPVCFIARCDAMLLPLLGTVFSTIKAEFKFKMHNTAASIVELSVLSFQ